MIEYGITPEHARYALEALGLLSLAMAYTTRQREWILRRDNHECQACRLGISHQCNGSVEIPTERRRLQVHHLIPQRYAREIGLEDCDFAENGITLCEHFHQNVIHPDMTRARNRYRRGDKEAYKKVGIDRDALLSERTIYWNDEYDRIMTTRAIQQTQRFENEDDPFPTKEKPI